MTIEKVSAIAISVLVVLVLAYKAIVEKDPQSTTALIALASPAAAVAIIRRQESTEGAPVAEPTPEPAPATSRSFEPRPQ